MDKFFNVELPKWCMMYVTGEDITKEQALEIIRRTDAFFKGYEGNNNNLNNFIKNTLKIPNEMDFFDYIDYDEEKTKWDKKWGYIFLDFISNQWISSTDDYGANGWCHPDGKMGIITTIGKYPIIEIVYTDWNVIAHEFPFLNLGITLYDGEFDDNNAKPLISFKIKEGKVEVVHPSKENVHESHNYETCEDYLDTLDFKPFTTKKGDIINYTLENAISMEQIMEWSKIIKEEKL